MASELIGTTFIMNNGMNEIADIYGIVVLYPQVKATNYPFNIYGCWDWWGYTNLYYAIKKGEQMGVIKAMIDKLSQIP